MRHTSLVFLASVLSSCALAVSPEEVTEPLPEAPVAPAAVDAGAGLVLSVDVAPLTVDRAVVVMDAGIIEPERPIPCGPCADTQDVTADAGASTDAPDVTDLGAPRANRRVLTVTLDDDTQRACAPGGWSLVTWDTMGMELPASDPGRPLRVEFPWTWRGMLGVAMRCEAGFPAHYRDLSPWLDAPVAGAGVRSITLDGRDITARSRVCDPPWVRAARPTEPVSWRTVLLVALESALEGACPR